VINPRLATAIHGIGLLEQIPESEILANPPASRTG